jgi:hypothetical protein
MWPYPTIPDTLLELAGAVRELTRERDDLANDEFGDGARVGERRVEDGDTLLGRAVEVDLVRADAEAADNKELNASSQRAEPSFTRLNLHPGLLAGSHR